MTLEETFSLANGVLIPKLGFGTWLIEGDTATEATKTAIACGYRSIDTAQAYGNEAEVGLAVRESRWRAMSSSLQAKLLLSLKPKKKQPHPSTKRSPRWGSTTWIL